MTKSEKILQHFRFGIKDEKHEEFTVSEAYAFTAAALTNRGWTTVPSMWSGRIVFIRFEVHETQFFQ